jgi:hypothetical protein
VRRQRKAKMSNSTEAGKMSALKIQTLSALGCPKNPVFCVAFRFRQFFNRTPDDGLQTRDPLWLSCEI